MSDSRNSNVIIKIKNQLRLWLDQLELPEEGLTQALTQSATEMKGIARQAAIASLTRAMRTLRSPNALMLLTTNLKPMATTHPCAKMAMPVRQVLKSAAAVSPPSNVKRTVIWETTSKDLLDTAQNAEVNACLAHLRPGEIQASTMQQNLRIDKAAAGAAKATHQLAAEAHVDSAPLAALVAAIATLDPSVVMQVAVKIKVMRATKALTRKCT